MATIQELAQRSQRYIDQLNQNIDRVIYSVEQALVDLNRKQLLESKGNDDKALVNERTGSEYLSRAYAKKTQKSKPNLFVNGNYQDEMRLTSKYDANNYSIFSYHRLEKYLPKQYLNSQGIAPSNQDEAKSITTQAIGQDYKQALGL